MIHKICNINEIDLLSSIAKSYSTSQERLEKIRVRLLKELSELGSNRDIYIKFNNDLPVAMIQIIYNNADNDPDLANSKTVAHIHDLEVIKHLQGKGYGKEMMTFIENEASKRGIKQLTLGVDSPNTRAIKLYNDLGYSIFKEEEGRIPEEKLLLMIKNI